MTKLAFFILALGAMAIVSNAQPTAALDQKAFTMNPMSSADVPMTYGWSVNSATGIGHIGRITQLFGGGDANEYVVQVAFSGSEEFSGTLLLATTPAVNATPTFDYNVSFNGRRGLVFHSSDGAQQGIAKVKKVGDGMYEISWLRSDTGGNDTLQYAVATAAGEVVPDMGPATLYTLATNCGGTGITCNSGYSCNRSAGVCEMVNPFKAPWADSFGVATQCADGTIVLSPAGCGGWYHGGTANSPGHGCAAVAPCWCGNQAFNYPASTQPDNVNCVAAVPSGSISCDYSLCK